MLLKLFFFAVILYFVVKTTARLIHAMKADPDPSRLDRKPSNGRDGTPPQRPYDEEDVEDAKFVDV